METQLLITKSDLELMLIENNKHLLSEIQLLLSKPKSIRIKQNEAYQLYGRANVKNWRMSGQLKAYKMLRAVEYVVADLDQLMKQKQLIIKPTSQTK